MQSENRLFDDFVKMVNGFAGTMAGMGREAETNAREKFREWMAGSDFVGRDEFEAVKAMAAAARDENEILNARIAALEAKVHVVGPNGERMIAFSDFHRLPGDTPQLDTHLNPNEIVTAVELPAEGFAKNYSYLKIRDRLSYAFALVSVAAALELEGGTIRQARVALGGVAHKPWRDTAAEVGLRGQPTNQATFTRAADLLLREAKGFAYNAFKIELARRSIVRALMQAAQVTPQSQSNKKIR